MYICVRKCFWQNRLWTEGEELGWNDPTASPPHHFALKDGVDAERIQAVKAKEQEIVRLRKELDERGLTYDMRWGISKLEALLSLSKRDKKEIKDES